MSYQDSRFLFAYFFSLYVLLSWHLQSLYLSLWCFMLFEIPSFALDFSLTNETRIDLDPSCCPNILTSTISLSWMSTLAVFNIDFTVSIKSIFSVWLSITLNNTRFFDHSLFNKCDDHKLLVFFSSFVFHSKISTLKIVYSFGIFHTYFFNLFFHCFHFFLFKSLWIFSNRVFNSSFVVIMNFITLVLFGERNFKLTLV